MDTNVGTVDAFLRAAFAASFGGLAIVVAGNIIASLSAAIIALALGATAVTHHCPIYSALGIDTSRHTS